MQLARAFAKLLKAIPDAEMISMEPATASEDSPAQVWAQTRDFGVRLALDADVRVPLGSFRAQDLRKISVIKAADHVFFGEHGGYGSIPLSVGPISGTVTLEPQLPFPKVESAPGFQDARSTRDWSALQVVSQFAGDTHQGLSCVSVTDHRAEATDRVAFARARVDLGVSGMLPLYAVRDLPAGVSKAWVSPGRAWIMAAEELRWTTLYRTEFPDTSQIPERHPWQQTVVSLDVFLDAVVRAAGVQSTRVLVDVGDGLRLSFEGMERPVLIPGTRCPPARGWFSVPRLGKMLRRLSTPAVAVGLGPRGTPLRLDSGVLSMCLWPLAGDAG